MRRKANVFFDEDGNLVVGSRRIELERMYRELELYNDSRDNFDIDQDHRIVTYLAERMLALDGIQIIDTDELYKAVKVVGTPGGPVGREVTVEIEDGIEDYDVFTLYRWTKVQDRWNVLSRDVRTISLEEQFPDTIHTALLEALWSQAADAVESAYGDQPEAEKEATAANWVASAMICLTWGPEHLMK